MNIRLRAAVYTVGFLAAVWAGAFAVVAIANLGGFDPEIVFAILLVAFGVYTMYQLMLSKIKFDDEIDAIEKRINERIEKGNK
jgi:hypothetical protein